MKSGGEETVVHGADAARGTRSTGGLFEFTLPFERLAITAPAVARGLGYTETPAHLLDEINAALPRAAMLAQPRGGFMIVPPSDLAIAPGKISCRSVELLAGRVITKRLRPSVALAIFVATAGPRLEEWSRELMDAGDMMQGFMVDAIGSEVVERVGDALEVKVSEAIAGSYVNTTNRYSPGYCGWTVFEQHKLFSLLPPAFCGITLTESALMTPIKSMSGIMGLGPETERKEYECSLCDMENCFRRRARYMPDQDTEDDDQWTV